MKGTMLKISYKMVSIMSAVSMGSICLLISVEFFLCATFVNPGLSLKKQITVNCLEAFDWLII